MPDFKKERWKRAKSCITTVASLQRPSYLILELGRVSASYKGDTAHHHLECWRGHVMPKTVLLFESCKIGAFCHHLNQFRDSRVNLE